MFFTLKENWTLLFFIIFFFHLFFFLFLHIFFILHFSIFMFASNDFFYLEEYGLFLLLQKRICKKNVATFVDRSCTPRVGVIKYTKIKIERLARLCKQSYRFDENFCSVFFFFTHRSKINFIFIFPDFI